MGGGTADPLADRWLRRVVSLRDGERPQLLHAFAAFFMLLMGCFIFLPLRDEAGVALGTDSLPLLFGASLVVTMVAAPSASAAMSASRLPRPRLMHLFYRIFASSLVLFYLLHEAFPPPPPVASGATDGPPAGPLVDAQEGRRSSLTTFVAAKAWALWRAAAGFSVDPAALGSDAGDHLHWGFVATRAAFFLHVSFMNQLGMSILWARLADVMTSESGARLYGFIGAGATLGQLTGSVFAASFARLGPAMLLVAAALLEGAGWCAGRLGPIGTPGSDSEASKSKGAPATRGLSPWRRVADLARRQSEGIRLVAASRYLRAICAYLGLSAMVSSFFYFQKALLITKTAVDSHTRTAIFAWINGLSAACTLVTQLFVTGRFLSTHGLTAALCAAPAVAVVSMAAITGFPMVAVLAVTEAARKVVNYSFSRPGRELLFNVVSRDEKVLPSSSHLEESFEHSQYKAKVIIDTLVQRVGDSLAAGLFSALGSTLLLGPAGLAAAMLPICMAWLACGQWLGRMQKAMASGASGSGGGGGGGSPSPSRSYVAL